MKSASKLDSAGEFPPSVHAYCRSAALCAAFSINRSAEKTLLIEFAEKGAQSGYDWSNKIGFQLSQGELAELSAYLRRPWKSHKWVHRAPGGAVKGLQLTLQGANVLFELSMSERRILVPVIPRDQYFLRNLAWSRLLEIQPPQPAAAHLASLEQLAETLSRT